jgi:serine/threonine-protein kinase
VTTLAFGTAVAAPRGDSTVIVEAPPAHRVVPVAVVDAVLDAALGANADYVWLEPVAQSTEHYLVSVERAGSVIATSTVDSQLASAMIARLAFITNVDLTSSRAVTGSAPIRGRGRDADLVFTLRPGAELRGEAMLVNRGTRLTVSRERFDDLSPGDRVGHYRVLARLGAGGMGSVYRVEHATLGRVHALKVLHGKVLRRDAGSIDRFLREARAASRIQHPHIVDVFDFGYLPDGRPYFVMELLDGDSLGDLIDRGALQPAQAVSVARQLAEALAAAHDHGVIHADVSPSNVLVATGTKVKLVDFGLAELRDRDVSRDAPADYVLGTPCYISPEQIRGNPADERSDQYSFGIVVFEMIAGKPPYNDRNIRELCMKHLRDPVPELLSPFGPMPDDVCKLVERLLAKSPQARYPNMRAVLADLDEIAKLVDRKGWRRWLAP